MSTHLSGYRSFFNCLHRFVLGKLATSSVRVNIIELRFNIACFNVCKDSGVTIFNQLMAP